MTTVTIYTTPTCPWCKRTKEFFTKNSVKYKEVDVAGDEKAQKALIEKSGQMAVPVIDVDGNIVVGFQEEELKKLLKIK